METAGGAGSHQLPAAAGRRVGKFWCSVWQVVTWRLAALESAGCCTEDRGVPSTMSCAGSAMGLSTAWLLLLRPLGKMGTEGQPKSASAAPTPNPPGPPPPRAGLSDVMWPEERTGGRLFPGMHSKCSGMRWADHPHIPCQPAILLWFSFTPLPTSLKIPASHVSSRLAA